VAGGKTVAAHYALHVCEYSTEGRFDELEQGKRTLVPDRHVMLPDLQHTPLQPYYSAHSDCPEMNHIRRRLDEPQRAGVCKYME
jgi:hypothetical protein